MNTVPKFRRNSALMKLTLCPASGFLLVKVWKLFCFAAQMNVLAFLLTMEQRQLRTYIQLTILRAFSLSSAATEGLWSWLMAHYAILITVPIILWHIAENYAVENATRGLTYSPGLTFPHPFPNSAHRLLDAPKLSWNLITPLTSTFQPQFFFSRAILAEWQENTEPCKSSRWGNYYCPVSS